MSVETAEPALRGDRDEGLHREPKFGGGGVEEEVPHEDKTIYTYVCISTLQTADCNTKRPFRLPQLDSCFHVH